MRQVNRDGWVGSIPTASTNNLKNKEYGNEKSN